MINDSQIQEMITRAKTAMKNAYNPYSHFFVGACILADDGKYYSGCNVENASYRMTLCAENSAVGNMITHGGKHVMAVAIIGSADQPVVPCGACRQLLREFSALDTPFYMCDESGNYKMMTMDELLPESFGPEFLEK